MAVSVYVCAFVVNFCANCTSQRSKYQNKIQLNTEEKKMRSHTICNCANPIKCQTISYSVVVVVVLAVQIILFFCYCC